MAMAGKRTVTQEPLGSVDRSVVREDSLPAIHLTTRHTTLPSHIRPRSLCMIYCGNTNVESLLDPRDPARASGQLPSPKEPSANRAG